MQKLLEINQTPAIQKTLITGYRITEFEGLRAILAWWVVAAHLLQACGVQIQHVPRLLIRAVSAGYAVDVFIILSGFVIFLLLDSSSKNYRQFIAERFFRIYPLFLITFIAAIILLPLRVAVLKTGLWNNLEYALQNLHHVQNTYDFAIFHILSHLTLLHGIFPDEILPSSSTAFLRPAWSISLEWQFYLIAPFLLVFLRRSLPFSFLCFGIIFGVRHLVENFSFEHKSFLPLGFEFFLIGILSYYCYKFSQTKPKLVSKFFPFVATVLIVASGLLCFHRGLFIPSTAIPLTIWLVALSAVIAQSLQIKFLPANFVSRVLNYPLLQNLGKVSYSTYLGHILVFWALMWVTMRIAPDIDRNTMLIILSSLGSACIVATSFALYRWIEKPFIQVGKRVSKKLAVSRI